MPDPARTLNTASTNGHVSVNLLKKLGESRHSLTSSHNSTNGYIEVFYPDDWEGTIEAKSGTKSCEIKGDGVVILSSKRNWLGKLVTVAVKGEHFEAYDPSFSIMKVGTTNGTVTVQFEERREEEQEIRQSVVQQSTIESVKREDTVPVRETEESIVQDGMNGTSRPITPPPAYDTLPGGSISSADVKNKKK